MRILLSSHVFAPSVGGIERVSELLAAEFVRQGHEVRVITQTVSAEADDRSYAVYRRPSVARLVGLVRWCDVFFHNNISLSSAWPLLLVSRPWVVAHHVWIPRRGFVARLKRLCLRFARGISISRAMAEHFETPSEVIPNPYDDTMYRVVASVEKRLDLIFVGRLVSDKGADLLLSAVAELRDRGLAPTTTIVGDGPEAPALRARCRALGLDQAVAFTGSRTAIDLVRLFNEHRIVVVPSRWEEPFGLVAIEGIACGCVAVGSVSGGLPEAIGDCGETFTSGSASALADTLDRVLRDPGRQLALREGAAGHLHRHACATVAAQYLRVFRHSIRDVQGSAAGRGVPNV